MRDGVGFRGPGLFRRQSSINHPRTVIPDRGFPRITGHPSLPWEMGTHLGLLEPAVRVELTCKRFAGAGMAVMLDWLGRRGENRTHCVLPLVIPNHAPSQ